MDIPQNIASDETLVRLVFTNPNINKINSERIKVDYIFSPMAPGNKCSVFRKIYSNQDRLDGVALNASSSNHNKRFVGQAEIEVSHFSDIQIISLESKPENGLDEHAHIVYDVIIERGKPKPNKLVEALVRMNCLAVLILKKEYAEKQGVENLVYQVSNPNRPKIFTPVNI